MNKIDEVIEQLQCAEINCDNVVVLGTGFAAFVKAQIATAIEMLEKINGTN